MVSNNHAGGLQEVFWPVFILYIFMFCYCMFVFIKCHTCSFFTTNSGLTNDLISHQDLSKKKSKKKEKKRKKKYEDER